MELSSDLLNQMSSQAKNFFEDGEYEQAADLFEKIYLEYERQGDTLNSAENKNNCSVAQLKAENPKKALENAQGTDQVFAAAGDKKRQAMALGNQAAAMEALGDLETALQTYQEASSLLKEIKDHELRPFVLKSISALEMRKGQYMQSMASMKAAIDGKNKPSLADNILKKLFGFIFKG